MRAGFPPNISMKFVYKPDLQKLVGAVRELTQTAVDLLRPVAGESFDIEKRLRQIISMAIERGIELQREVIIHPPDEVDTPLRPPPSDLPLPKPPKLPRT